jgi:hypothetical protein
VPVDELLVVSEPELEPMLDDDEVSLLVLEFIEPLVLPVPLAPMLVVPLLSELLAVLPVEPFSEELDLPEAPIVLESFLFSPELAFVPLVAEALVPELLVPLVPLVCAMAMPPTARAAAAASVVSVFLVVLMSCSP